MKHYKISIVTFSDTIFASGQGSAAIDSATRFHKNGLPYIPSKTLKGLLKESAIEVQEILGKEWNPDLNDNIINLIFGNEGVGNSSLIKIENAEIVNKWKYIKDISSNGLLPGEVIQYFTKIRQQTAIEENGIARKGSLRSSLVLNEGVKFIALISLNDAKTEVFELLKKACINLRRVGTNRNRGFGKVKVNIDEYSPNQNHNQNLLKGNVFKLILRSPALLPTTQVDANTVSSEKVISGRKILGMIASSYIRLNNLHKDAHKDATFEAMFLNGNVTFSDAYPVRDNKICFSIGNHWKTNKGKDAVYNDYDENYGLNLKSIGGFVNLDGSSRASVSTVLDFHNSRNKVNQKDIEGNHSRIAGSNKGAGIFYYEKLEEDQSFVFKIDGNEANMQEIRKLLTNDIELRIGKSTSTNLGQIEIVEWDKEWISDQNQKDEEVILTFISPVILKNKFGDFEASLSCLQNYLGVENIEAKNTRVRTQMVQVFQGSINMQMPEMVAIEAGSSIALKRSQLSRAILDSSVLGEFTHEGYGRFVIESLQNEIKLEYLKNLIGIRNIDVSNDKKPLNFIRITEKSTKFLNFINEQRQILEAKKLGDSEAIREIHKGTTMQMIQLFKMVKQCFITYEMNFSACLQYELERLFRQSVYSIKTVDNLGKVIGNLSDDIKRERKSNTDRFKEKLISWMVTGFENKSKNPKSDLVLPKIEFWIAYFNKTKIKNRDGK